MHTSRKWLCIDILRKRFAYTFRCELRQFAKKFRCSEKKLSLVCIIIYTMIYIQSGVIFTSEFQAVEGLHLRMSGCWPRFLFVPMRDELMSNY